MPASRYCDRAAPASGGASALLSDPRTPLVDLDRTPPTAPRTRTGPDTPSPSTRPLRLDRGVDLGPFAIAYQTYGTLNPERSNAILICHALTGDQYAADPHPITGNAGWWTSLVGPGNVLDTERYFLICTNVLGGCMGTTGPKEINPATGEPWALDFPVITIRDMVRAQKLLIEHLGIEQLFCVIGGSMGGMQVLQWASSYPESVFAAIPIASAARHSAQNIAFHEVGRQAIMADPDWCGGRYLTLGRKPARGLAVARMAAHITYLSEAALHRKFGRNLQDRNAHHLRVRRRFPGRELSAAPGQHVRRPLRRQFVPLHHAGDGLFRPCRRARRVAAGGVSGARSRASASSRSPATGCSRPRRAALSCTR